MTLPPAIVGFRAAFVFLSRLPLGGHPYRDEDWHWAPAHFPAVGLVVGLLGAGILYLTAPLGSPVAATLCVLSTVLITGAFHEDGLADSADALGGAHGPKALLEILHDSRIGTYGASALVLGLLLRVLVLSELVSQSLFHALLSLPAIHALSRVAPVWLMAALRYAGGQGSKGAFISGGRGWPRAIVASAWGLLVLTGAWALGTPPLLLAAWGILLLVVSTWLGRTFVRRAGGYTGDFLGATEQVLEIALLLAALAGERLLSHS